MFASVFIRYGGLPKIHSPFTIPGPIWRVRAAQGRKAALRAMVAPGEPGDSGHRGVIGVAVFASVLTRHGGLQETYSRFINPGPISRVRAVQGGKAAARALVVPSGSPGTRDTVVS